MEGTHLSENIFSRKLIIVSRENRREKLCQHWHAVPIRRADLYLLNQRKDSGMNSNHSIYVCVCEWVL